MDDHVARTHYEHWCKVNGKRKSEAGWELWLAAWRAKSPELDGLTTSQRRVYETLIESFRADER